MCRRRSHFWREVVHIFNRSHTLDRHRPVDALQTRGNAVDPCYFPITVGAVRRRVDWDVILAQSPPEPALVESSARAEAAAVVEAFRELFSLEEPDLLLRRAVELSREKLGLKRAALFLLDEERQLMLGTFGTTIDGRTSDERQVMYQVGPSDRAVFRRAEEGGAPYTVLENCPLVEQLEHETRVVGQGWVACTPIRSARGNLGILFNDAGLTGLPVDERQQGRVALYCSFLGVLLDRKEIALDSKAPESAAHPAVVGALRLLAQDPSLGGKELADRLNLSVSRLARLFKAEMGVSLVDYRNRLRLERFDVLLRTGSDNLLETALAAGFGSYAQFHRVFSAERGTPPTKYLQSLRGSHKAR